MVVEQKPPIDEMIETSRFSGSNFLKADKHSDKLNHSDSDDQGGITAYGAAGAK